MERPKRNYCLKVWGDLACFTRPELKVERVSYDVITPSATRAIFTAIFWKPAILWQITRIEVLQPIRFASVRRNEVGAVASKGKTLFIEDSRQQRAGILLRDVAYRLHADLVYLAPEERHEDRLPPDNGPETPEKYYAMFERRAQKGQNFHTPYLGCREFAANYQLIPAAELAMEQEKFPPLPSSCDRDFGVMLYDMDYTRPDAPEAMFFRPVMREGVIEVPNPDSVEVLR